MNIMNTRLKKEERKKKKKKLQTPHKYTQTKQDKKGVIHEINYSHMGIYAVALHIHSLDQCDPSH